MINLVISGHLGRDADRKQVGSQSVLEFSVGSTTKVKGEKVTTWVRCQLWGARGDKLAQYLTKGTRVTCVGTGSLRTWKNREGVEKTDLNCSVDQLDFSGGGQRQEQPRPAEPATTTTTDDDFAEDVSDPLPF